jgi:anti-anti-sigma regulatory factor
MSTELEDYKKLVEDQQGILLSKLAQLGLTMDYDVEVSIPKEDTPLVLMFHAIKLVAENLASVSKDREAALTEVQNTLELVRKQSQAILELSTPVIQVWDDILVLPLIGTIDTARAQQIMENLLEAVVKGRAAVVIIDITGVPVVDTKVANHLIKTIQATRLLGAEAVVTGVSPHNAQTLVRLGVDLTSVTTRSSLQAGLRLAFELTRQKVSKI